MKKALRLFMLFLALLTVFSLLTHAVSADGDNEEDMPSASEDANTDAGVPSSEAPSRPPPPSPPTPPSPPPPPPPYPYQSTASILSKGQSWIILAVVVLLAAEAVFLIIRKKKKKKQ